MESITITIVEDLQEVREGLEAILNNSSDFLLLSSYNNGETALQHIGDEQPDIVVMDINLPGISGIECIKRLRDECPATLFIMYAIGGPGIHGFTFALLAGILVGTYSSIFIAAPIVLDLKRRDSTPLANNSGKVNIGHAQRA